MSDEDGSDPRVSPVGPEQGLKKLWGGVVRRRRLLGALAIIAVLILVPAFVLALGRSDGGTPVLGAAAAGIHEDPAQPVRGFPCSECHSTSSPSEDEPGLRDDAAKACLKCHRRDGESKASGSEHPPFARDQCLDCHRAHGGETAGQLKAEVRVLCFSCHGSKGRQVAYEYAHPPFAEGDCTFCHEPHQSPLSNLLRVEPPELCLSCHQATLGRVQRAANIHPPFSRGECTACHTPHASTVAGQLRGPVAEVCLSCHGTDTSHLDPEHPHVREGLCVSCHEPHGGEKGALLRGAGSTLCLSCHRK